MSLSTALHGVLNSAAYLRSWVPGSIFISLSTQLHFGQGHSQIISLGKWWLQQDAPNLPCEIANDIFSKTRDATLPQDWERDISNRNAVYPFFTCFFSSKWTLDLTRQPRSALFLLPHMLSYRIIVIFVLFISSPQALFASCIPEIIDLIGTRPKYGGTYKNERGRRYIWLIWTEVTLIHLFLERCQNHLLASIYRMFDTVVKD